jgi:hypothetical protein
MKIVCARLRSNVTYTGPLETVLDSFFYLYDLWMKQHPEYTYDSYNLSFDRKKKPRRDADVFKDADVVVIPSDSEFRYHGALQIDPRDLETSNNFIEEIKPHMEGKTVIMWRSDRGDTEELYRNETFKGVTLGDFHTIDEIDFPANIHGMKHHFIREAFFNNPLASLMSTELPQVDFAYWGRMKDGDDRGKIIRQLYRDPDITQILVGGFPSGVKRQASWIKEWSELFSYVSKARCTLCFNWRDPTATTSRYPEALAVGLVPFVWKDYDKNNTYAIEDFQRVSSFEELRERIVLLKEDTFYSTALHGFQENYKEILPNKLEYSEMFTQKMDKYLRR